MDLVEEEEREKKKSKKEKKEKIIPLEEEDEEEQSEGKKSRKKRNKKSKEKKEIEELITAQIDEDEDQDDDDGDFEVTPVNHLHGNGCPKCKAEYLSSSQRMSQHDFVKRANEIHNYKYDYSLLDYKGGSKKIDIICPIHGVFTQDPFSHLSGHGCPTCSNERLSLRFRSNTEEFIEKAKSVHGDLYDYKNVKYKNCKEKVEIICKIHGAFFQTPNDHLRGAGCPECSNSRGETAVSVYLEHHNIKYIRQFIIRNENVFCKNKIIKVDFYLPEYDSFIEFNGEQHYRPNEHFGGKAIFEKQKERDFALKQYCKEHNILFIEIPYTNLDSIDTMLDKKLKGKRKNRIPNHNTTM